MSKILLWTLFLDGILLIFGADKPPEAILPGDSIKPLIKLSLLSPDAPQEGDDVLLQCSAKPKNKSKESEPESVHWIKGNVGVPEKGHKPEAERYVREKSKDAKGVVLFTLTIKEIEINDADKYMCIVQVGETGYFTSNEIQVVVKPGDPEKKKEREQARKKQGEYTREEILSWKNRVSELSADELRLLADAVLEEENQKKEQKKWEGKETSDSNTKTEQDAVSEDERRLYILTEDEKDILRLRDDIADMSEIQLYKLSQALKKEKRIKEREEQIRKEEEKQKEKLEKEKKWREDIERRKKEAEEKAKEAEEKKKQEEEEKAKKAEETKKKEEERKRQEELQEKREEEKKKKEEEKKKKEEERFKLTPEEKAILKRKDELADFTGMEIKLLHKALAKQKDIDAKKKLNTESKKEEEVEEHEGEEPVLTEEEEAILARKSEIRSMSQDELKIMASAVTKQKKIQDARRKKYNIQIPEEGKEDEQGKEEVRDEKKNDKPVKLLDEQAKEPITAEELLMLMKRDNVMDLSNDELPFLARGLKKQQYLEDLNPNVGEDMTNAEMFEILAKKDKLVDMEQEGLDLFLVALLKEKKLKYGAKETQKPSRLEDEADKPITNEEVQMITRRNDVANLENDQLPILARALTKMEHRDKNDPTVGEDMSVGEMHNILDRENEIMDMNQKELDLFVAATIKQKKEKLKPRTRPEDEMSVQEMRRILKWQDERNIADLSQDELRQLGTAMLKEKKIKDAKEKKNDPLEGEHSHDEL